MASPEPIRVRLATAADVPSIARIGTDAFGFGPIGTALWPEHLRSLPGDGDRLAWRAAEVERMLANPTPDMHFIVAVAGDPSGDEQEVVVGYIDWRAPTTPEGDASSQEGTAKAKIVAERAVDLKERMKNWPAALDKEAKRTHDDQFTKLETETLGEGASSRMWRTSIFLEFLSFSSVDGPDRQPLVFRELLTLIADPESVAVDGRHRRKGIGALMVQWGLDRAKRDGNDVCLISSVAGIRLYSSLGFEILGSRVILGDKKTSMVWRAPQRRV
jgi:ribosomal protein S18 acetylase RimI-like enzyme